MSDISPKNYCYLLKMIGVSIHNDRPSDPITVTQEYVDRSVSRINFKFAPIPTVTESKE